MICIKDVLIYVDDFVHCWFAGFLTKTANSFTMSVKDEII